MGCPFGLLQILEPETDRRMTKPVEAEATYKDGELHGFIIRYNDDGKERFRETYKDGKRVFD